MSFTPTEEQVKVVDFLKEGRDLVTFERLKQLIIYIPETGIFLWRETRRGVSKGLAGTRRKDGRWQIRIDGKVYIASRLAHFYMTGAWPIALVDHKDRDNTNDKWENLRPATHEQNQINRGVASGVTFVKSRNKWQAQMKVYGKTKFLGRFNSREEAEIVYKKAAEQHEGDFRSWK